MPLTSHPHLPGISQLSGQLSLLELELVELSLERLVVRLQVAVLALHPLVRREKGPEIVLKKE